MCAERRVLSVWLGIVTYVVDGDTLYVRPIEGGKTVNVRIDGIDAPEICQVGGQQARDALKLRVLGHQVMVQRKTTDKYGRIVAEIFQDNVDQGAQMAATRKAWASRFKTGKGNMLYYKTKLRQHEWAFFN